MKYLVVLVQWMVLVTAMGAPAKAPKPQPGGNRFLFILETSAAMSRLEHGGRQAIFDLIYSGFDGRMRKGDTYGVWTFNEQVYAGVYPMQVWDGQLHLEHAGAAGRFLRTQKYEKDGNAANLIKQLEAVLRVAKDLNVFIVTDEKTVVSGTPFDAEINALYRTNGAHARRTSRPLITTLTARNGQFTAAAVNVAGEAITLANLPPRTNDVVKVTAAAPSLATNQLPAARKKPVGQIISISDAETQERTTNAPFVADEKQTAKIPVVVEQTNAVAPATNVVHAPPVFVSPLPTMPSNLTATVTPTTSAPVVATNETPLRPEPLSAVVPAQMTVSARTPADSAKRRAPVLSGNVMLICGGALLGASLVGALVFMRRMRATKQPSLISLGMDRK